MNSGSIHDNVATGMGGGGVFNKGIFNLNGGTIYRNSVGDAYIASRGGGIFNWIAYGAVLNIKGGRVYDNTKSYKGKITPDNICNSTRTI